jgi:hypothetical protein
VPLPQPDALSLPLGDSAPEAEGSSEAAPDGDAESEPPALLDGAALEECVAHSVPPLETEALPEAVNEEIVDCDGCTLKDASGEPVKSADGFAMDVTEAPPGGEGVPLGEAAREGEGERVPNSTVALGAEDGDTKALLLAEGEPLPGAGLAVPPLPLGAGEAVPSTADPLNTPLGELPREAVGGSEGEVATLTEGTPEGEAARRGLIEAERDGSGEAVLEEVTEGEGEAAAGVADPRAEGDGEGCPLVVDEPPPGARAAVAVAKAVGTPEPEGDNVAAPDALLPAPMLGVPAPAVPLGGALAEGGAEVRPEPVCEATPLSVGATLPVLRGVTVPLLSALPVALLPSVVVALPPALPVAPPLELCSSDAVAAGVADTGALGEPGSGEPLELPLAQGKALCVPVEERLTEGEDDAEPQPELLAERSGLLETEGQVEGLLELKGVALTPRDAVPARTDAVPDGDATQEPTPLALKAADELVRRLGVEAAEAAVPPPLAVAVVQPEEEAASEVDATLDLLTAKEAVASEDDETEGDSVLPKEEVIASVAVCELLSMAEWEGGALPVEVPLTDGEDEALFEGVALRLCGRDAEVKPVAVGARL